MAEKRDYYEVLGVSKSSGVDEIKKAYRQLAKKYHPDSNPGDKEAEQKFKEASEAYAILSDADKRAKYDQFGHSAFDGAGGAGFDFSNMDFSDISDILGGSIFGDIFGGMFGGGSRRAYNGPMKGQNIRTSVQIDFMEAVFGCEKELQLNLKEECGSCKATGAKAGTAPVTCSKCGGRGQAVQTMRTPLGVMQNVSTCPDCRGTGKIIKERCPDCNGSGYKTSRTKIAVSIPAGIDQENMVRISGKGEPGLNGGPRGDLMVSIYIRPHPIFIRRGSDILSSVKISFAQAALGCDILADTVDGQVIYSIKPGTATGTVVRLKGKGVPLLSSRRDNSKGQRGDQYITLEVEVPKQLSSEAKNAILEFDKITSNSIAKSKEAIENKTKKGNEAENANDKVKEDTGKGAKDTKKKKKGMWSEIGDFFK